MEESTIKIGTLYYHYIYGELEVVKCDDNYVTVVPSQSNEFFKVALANRKDGLLFSRSAIEEPSKESKGCILYLTPENVVKPFAENPEASYIPVNGSQGQWPKALGWGDFKDYDDLYANASDEGKAKIKKYGKDSIQFPLLFNIISLGELKEYIKICEDNKTDQKNPYFYGPKHLPKNKQDVKRVWIEDKMSLNPVYYAPVISFGDKKCSLLELRAESLLKSGKTKQAEEIKIILNKILEVAKEYK